MPPKTPTFWYRSNTTRAPLYERALVPISDLYQVCHRFNLKKTYTNQAPIPVICVGNLTAGGSGKTPVSIAINTLIRESALFQNPYFLTRGYGGNIKSPRRIEGHDDAMTVGDEPLILLKHSNTIISKNRYSGALHAYALGADCIIMDDGLQNNSLKKDLSFLVVNGKMGFGNEKTLPAGPLREPYELARQRIDAIIMIGEDERGILKQCADIPVFHCNLKPFNENTHDKSNNYVAFCGLGYPDKFFSTLTENGYKVVKREIYSDHYLYKDEDLAKLCDIAEKENAELITTEKDYVKIPQSYRSHVKVLPIQVIWQDKEGITAFIKQNLGR